MRAALIRFLVITVASALVLPATALAATATTTTLTADRTSFQYRHEVTYTVAVDPIPDGGVVVLKIRDFEDDVVVYRSAAPNPEIGSVAFKVTMGRHLPPIDYTVTATYLGTEAYSGSVSDPLIVKLNPNTTSTELEVRPASPYQALVPGGDATLTAQVDRSHEGFVRFSETTTGTPVKLRTVKLTANCCGGSSARMTITDVVEGPHTYTAEFLGSMTGQSSADSASAGFAWGVSTRLVLRKADRNPVQENHNVVFRFHLDAPRVGVPPAGTLSLVDLETGQVADTAAPSDGAFTFLAPSRGWHTYRAVYSGDEHFAGSTSGTRSVRIVPDVVEASVYGAGGAFWPSPRDGIADTFTFAGWRYERVRVKIRIHAPNGDLIVDRRIGYGTGAYEWAWNGRHADGRVRAEGSYRVVQELDDRFGNRLRVPGTVQLSYGTPPAI
jgi:hypothetical protein